MREHIKKINISVLRQEKAKNVLVFRETANRIFWLKFKTIPKQFCINFVYKPGEPREFCLQWPRQRKTKLIQLNGRMIEGGIFCLQIRALEIVNSIWSINPNLWLRTNNPKLSRYKQNDFICKEIDIMH